MTGNAHYKILVNTAPLGILHLEEEEHRHIDAKQKQECKPETRIQSGSREPVAPGPCTRVSAGGGQSLTP